MRQALLSDVYLASVNAMSEDGIMVNIDGRGNRISAIAFGPKTVILVVGMNKICRDLESARKRAHTYAAPNNALRLGLELPCTKRDAVLIAIRITRQVFALRLLKCTAALFPEGLK